jgi:hypothetical protein
MFPRAHGSFFGGETPIGERRQSVSIITIPGGNLIP